MSSRVSHFFNASTDDNLILFRVDAQGLLGLWLLLCSACDSSSTAHCGTDDKGSADQTALEHNKSTFLNVRINESSRKLQLGSKQLEKLRQSFGTTIHRIDCMKLPATNPSPITISQIAKTDKRVPSQEKAKFSRRVSQPDWDPLERVSQLKSKQKRQTEMRNKVKPCLSHPFDSHSISLVKPNT